MLAHGARDTLPAFEAREAGEGLGHPLERERERHDAAAVDRGGHRLLPNLGSSRDLPQHRMLAGVRRQPIAGGLPLLGPAEGEHPGVLARAVVLEARRLGPALEVVLRGRRLREQAADELELLGASEMRRARDRDLPVFEVAPRACEG